MPPAMPAGSSDSPITRPSTPTLVKPSALRTPISCVRSRTDCAMVLPTTTRMTKKTAERMKTMIMPTLPTWLAKPCAMAQGFANQVGNVGMIIVFILSAVFFVILVVVGNTMAQSVRERTQEIGVLKALGFTNVGVLGLVIGESLLPAGIAGGIGLALGYALVSQGDRTNGFRP